MQEVKHDLLTNKYTKIYYDEKYNFNAPNQFIVVKADAEVKENEFPEASSVLSVINFQEGPIKEYGVNGVANEDLIIMVLKRLEGFQQSEFHCAENAMAILHLEKALEQLRKRTMGREKCGVEGTHII